ncbi:hypothetical protein [Nonomuraea polychroma]|uniref:hypothetical protein n=1 Tax=Nonomuraea polychroma TaxID=46176 RepID=UPI000FDDE0EA|nr:hypothetical protein [Nonomuraea polychroma]
MHAYPGGQARRQVWFERDADTGDAFTFPGEGLKGPKESLVSQTRPNALSKRGKAALARAWVLA